MNENELDIQEIIEAAVTAAHEAGVKGMDEKIQAAINVALPIGIKIGAEVGSKIGAEVGSKIGAEMGAAAAIEAMEREQEKYRQKQYDWKYHNTKLLLRNYRRLKKYFENAVFSEEDAEEADESFEGIMRGASRAASEKIFVESIQKNYITTKIIMTHVNKMLEVYEIMCKRSSRKDDARHWRVLEGLYISDDYTTAEKIAKRENIDKRTVYRDVDICVADLTALLFGVGGIESL